ncbi:MAG: hypothetical protein HY020_04790 [Burkholderiales bacterium]|nr:hypothetical protein [Burkholderiales bacterium]
MGSSRGLLRGKRPYSARPPQSGLESQLGEALELAIGVFEGVHQEGNSGTLVRERGPALDRAGEAGLQAFSSGGGRQKRSTAPWAEGACGNGIARRRPADRVGKGRPAVHTVVSGNRLDVLDTAVMQFTGNARRWYLRRPGAKQLVLIPLEQTQSPSPAGLLNDTTPSDGQGEGLELCKDVPAAK